MLEPLQLLKKAELYFYTFFILFALAVFDISPRGADVLLGFITLKDFETTNFDLATGRMCVFLSILCFLFNWKAFKTSLKAAIETNKSLLAIANKHLNSLTNLGHRASSVSLNGVLEPTINAGAWTFYKAAREPVVISISRGLALKARTQGLTLALFKTALSFLLPLILGIVALIYIILRAVSATTPSQSLAALF